MPRLHKDLFARIANFQALHAAFAANLETNLLRLERELGDRTWRPGRYVEIQVKDPKPRIVSAAPFRDRVVHHAVYAVIAPIFESGFIHHSYSNRDGKGTHRAVAQYEHWRDRHRHVLRCDIYRYFPAIDHAILKATLRRRIACPDTLWLLDAIIGGSNKQEPVNLHFPGDDLFTPFNRRRGLPIGNLTSQFLANVYLDGLDHFATEVLRAPYLRYVDDFALFHDDPAVLADWRQRIGAWLEGRRLRLHPRKTVIQPTRQRTPFLGYDLQPGRRRLPELSVRRFRNRLRGLRNRWRADNVDRRPSRGPGPHRRLGRSRIPCRYVAPAPRDLPRRVVRPGVEAWPSPGSRVLRGGSWNNNPWNVRSGARNRNQPGNRNNNIGFRVASTPPCQSRPGHGPSGRAGAAFRDGHDEWGRLTVP